MKRRMLITCIIVSIIAAAVLGFIAWDTYIEYTAEEPAIDERQQITNFIDETTNIRNDIIFSLEDLSDAVDEGTDQGNIYDGIKSIDRDIKTLDKYLKDTQVPVEAVILKTKITEFASISSDISMTSKKLLTLLRYNENTEEEYINFNEQIKELTAINDEINNMIRVDYKDYSFEYDPVEIDGLL